MGRGTSTVDINPPKGGVRYDLPAHLIPPGYLYEAENVMIRDGRLVQRPGYAKLATLALAAGSARGLIAYKDTSGNRRFVAGTEFKWYESSTGATWTDITGTGLSGQRNQVRFVLFQTGTSLFVIGVNYLDTPKRWNGSDPTYVNLGGTPPKAKDITVCANRVILANLDFGAGRAPSQIAVSAFNDPESGWSSNLVDIPETEDSIVGVRALSRIAFAVLKDKSQWLGVAQTGAKPFRYEVIDTQPGPVSPASVVRIGGAVYYMGQDASFWRFDGVRAENIGKPIRRHIINTATFDSLFMTHGVYRKIDNQIWWIYSNQRGGWDLPPTVNLGVSYSLDTGEWQPLRFADSLLASTASEEVNSVSWDALTGTWDTLASTYPAWDAFGGDGAPAELFGGPAIGANGGAIFQIARGSVSDNGTAIDSFWTLPLTAITGRNKITRFDALDTFFKKTSVPVTVEVSVGKSDTLGQGPQFNPAQGFDISIDEKHQITEVDFEGRFVTVKHRVNSAQGGVEWYGGEMYANEKGNS